MEFLKMRLLLCLSIPRTLSLGTVKQVFLFLILEICLTSFLFCKILLMNLWNNCMKQKAVEVNTALPLFSFPKTLDIFLDVSSRRFVSLHRTIQLPLLQHYCSGHRLGILWYWMVCLGNKQIILSLHPSTAFWILLLTMMATPFLLSDSCSQ